MQSFPPFLFSRDNWIEGGVHSGCGLSALLWIIVAASVQFQEAKLHPTILLVALVICLACVALTCFSAFPIIRRPFHKCVKSRQYNLPRCAFIQLTLNRSDFLTVFSRLFIVLLDGEFFCMISLAFQIVELSRTSTNDSRIQISRTGIVSTFVYVLAECMWNVEGQSWDLDASRLITKPQLWFLITILFM
jgi:hypothetical protein